MNLTISISLPFDIVDRQTPIEIPGKICGGGVSEFQERVSFHRACYRRHEIRRHGIARIRWR